MVQLDHPQPPWQDTLYLRQQGRVFVLQHSFPGRQQGGIFDCTLVSLLALSLSTARASLLTEVVRANATIRPASKFANMVRLSFWWMPEGWCCSLGCSHRNRMEQVQRLMGPSPCRSRKSTLTFQ